VREHADSSRGSLWRAFHGGGEFRELLERVPGLAGHRLPNGDLMTLLKHGLEAYERELTKERFALGRARLRIFACAAALTISGMRGNTMENLVGRRPPRKTATQKRPCSMPDRGGP